MHHYYMHRRSAQGFTLVELLVVIAIIAILAAVVVLIINPLELTRRSRDVSRLSDFDNLQKAINIVVQDAPNGGSILCTGVTSPCTGRSDTGTRALNGGGWVKANFTGQTTITIPTLPVDPTNNETFHYTYYSDSTDYELNAVLESAQQISKMTNDGGNNNSAYETGTKLTLMP